MKTLKKINAKVKVPYSAKVKARNLLSNISYRRIKEQDLDNFSFIVDVYSFLIKDVNPFFWTVNLIMKAIMKWFLCCSNTV